MGISLGFYVCVLHFAFCLLTCASLHREQQVKGQSAKRKAPPLRTTYCLRVSPFQTRWTAIPSIGYKCT
jgi:hypothetical protein